ncbi:methionine aminopeptidase [Ascobolus immersus RN42]|uniref:Methionine aminopeptidase n=1 Tax=Ascobolus immersus RN42 TaxID=1160509 RepID=A0A3N4HK65_ASCIM|nr:methionine aminopeptidase [Ascobolus immersus RN42]
MTNDEVKVDAPQDEVKEVTKEVPLCSGIDCGKPAGKLQCPTCLKLGKASFFCSQDCFKKSWVEHKRAHPTPIKNPFPNFNFTGKLRPAYPLSAKREVPASIPRPDYADHPQGVSQSEVNEKTTVAILNEKDIEGMRKVCRLAREVLDIAAAAVRPGITTDEIDRIVHEACIERDSYPSPLNYSGFPKSVCTSINEVICHGIPDQRPLEDGDIINIDVTLYHGGYHGDINETYYVGPKSYTKENVWLVETARQCLDKAISIVKPGMPFREPGNVIEKLAKGRKLGVVRTYCGHGVHKLFHCLPNIPHYARNKAVGIAKEGQTFSIEPMINGGGWRDHTWPDGWTSSTLDGSYSSQFEHTMLVTKDGVEVLTARLPNSPGGPPSQEILDNLGIKFNDL